MEVPEQLRQRARRGYERGRLTMALRPVAPVMLAAAALSWWSGQADACLCLGVVVAGAVTALRFAGRGGTEAARDGLRVGAAVALTVVATLALVPACDLGALTRWCGLGCGVVGLGAGVWLARRLRTRRPSRGTLLGAAVVAAGAAAMGCVGLGTGALLGLAGAAAAGCAAATAWWGSPQPR